MKPIIGITCSYDYDKASYHLASAYTKAILAAGGLPVILPNLKDTDDIKGLLNRINGLLLAGGGDVDPIFFGEEPQKACGFISPERDVFEIELTRLAVEKEYPVLGLCRGAQLLNIALGGQIYQDLEEFVASPCKHSQEAPRWYPTHSVKVESGTLLVKILSENTTRVNSFHHQSISQLAPGFRTCARSLDGVIEAVEKIGTGFALGVQWHPEYLWAKDSAQLNIFRAFVLASIQG